MDEIENLVKNLKRNAQSARQAQIRLVECASVDWAARTMTATGAADGIEYLDVRLGLGAIYTKPAVGSICLIGIIDGLEVASFLFATEEVEEIVVDGGKNGGLVISQKTADKLNALESDINNLKAAIAGWVPVAQDGGAALKVAVASWMGQQLVPTVAAELENDKIRH